jgi:hypothetical protein
MGARRCASEGTADMNDAATHTTSPGPLGEQTAHAATEAEIDLASLLAKAGILIFEYDADGYLLCASGSCLGGGDPELEVRMGLATPTSVRRATGGSMVVEWVRIADRTIAVHHEPVRSDREHIERVVATAFDITNLAATLAPMGRSIVTPLHMEGAPARPRPALLDVLEARRGP